ncbi:MAG: hypothetical protein LBI71_01410 [Enterobacteriaceae bacterium]|jgi:WD40 repeat protein|nr:hypothetical protein [Enterobacteriaceae bacterium]
MITHHAPINGISAYRDKYVLTAGYDNQVILWDAKTQRPIACAMHDHLANQGIFSPDGNYAVTSSSDYSARLWTVPYPAGKHMSTLTILMVWSSKSIHQKSKCLRVIHISSLNISL